MKTQILILAVTLALVLPSFGAMSLLCRDDGDCPAGMICRDYQCVMVDGTETTWTCDGSSKVKCSAQCGKCGTSVSGTGALKGSHRCS